MSKELKAFLRAWLWWVMTGAVEIRHRKYHFRRGEGLCWSIDRYLRGFDLQDRVQKELKRMFKTHGLDIVYPFGFDDFDNRNDKKTMHLCPKRVGWVIKVLEENPDV